VSTTPKKRLQIAERRSQVARLYLQGRVQSEIASELGLAQATVCKDLKRIRTAWRESAIRDFEAQKELELLRLGEIEREAWKAWQRSQQPAQSAVVDGVAGGQRSRRTVKHQYGDPRFLELALRCNEERRKLFGLDAPTKIAPTTPDGRPLTIEQRKTHILAILKEQFGAHAIAIHMEVSGDGSEASQTAAGEHDRSGTLAFEPDRVAEEPFTASSPIGLPQSNV
jgi:hypothetical protein